MTYRLRYIFALSLASVATSCGLAPPDSGVTDVPTDRPAAEEIDDTIEPLPSPPQNYGIGGDVVSCGVLQCKNAQWWTAAVSYSYVNKKSWIDTDLKIPAGTPIVLRRAATLEKQGVYAWGWMPEFKDEKTGEKFRFLHLRPDAQYVNSIGTTYDTGTVVGISGGNTLDTGYNKYSSGAHLCVQSMVAFAELFPATKDTCSETCPTRCGDENVDPGEECDGSSLNAKSCNSLGRAFTGGVLHCTKACRFDVSSCTIAPTCSDAETCSGHGSCTASAGCLCSAAYGGPACNSCAAGYSGAYPNCCPNGCSGHGECNETKCYCAGVWGDLDCSRAPPAATETCDGVDNDGNGVIDDPNSCWTTIYRFKNPANEARCWNNSATAPTTCATYAYEREAFLLHQTQVTNAFPLVQCSKSTDHILVDGTSGDVSTLTSSGYDCSLILGYAYPTGSSLHSPWPYECPLYRFSSTAGESGAHLFSVGTDSTSGWTCERPARASVPSNQTCFAAKPSGC